MSEIKRKKNESFDSFMRRVKRGWKSSGKILQAKKIQFHQAKKSKNVVRTQTVRKNRLASKTTYLQKIGRLPVDDRQMGQRRR